MIKRQILRDPSLQDRPLELIKQFWMVDQSVRRWNVLSQLKLNFILVLEFEIECLIITLEAFKLV